MPVLWVLIAGLHVAAAAYAWRLLPHGFAVGHPRFWTNQVLPLVLVAASITCVFALWRRRARMAAIVIAAFTGFHVALGPAWSLAFPITGIWLAVRLGVLAIVLCACAFGSLRTARGMRLHVAIGAAIGLCAGGALPFAERGGAPATHPRESVGPLVAAAPPALPAWARMRDDTLTLDLGAVQVQLDPMLRFISRSPDRGWTVFAGAHDRIGTPEPAVLRAWPREDLLHVEVETVLAKAVYSHLNSFCAFGIRGHRRLFLAFSPMPAQRIEVTYSEYPVGRPARFAYVDAASVLHVVEAESGEKGPFTELARGPLAGALGITLFDADRPIADITLADFAAQASTQASPTAGWGVPENAIEFSLVADRPDALASIYITLAGTSVGRGWDSVGHAPGLYRNRIEIRRRE
jgi:hypothetical protein